MKFPFKQTSPCWTLRSRVSTDNFSPKTGGCCSLVCSVLGTGEDLERSWHGNRAMFSPLAGGHYCLIGSLVSCLLDESRGTLWSPGRIHAKLETIKMPGSKWGSRDNTVTFTGKLKIKKDIDHAFKICPAICPSWAYRQFKQKALKYKSYPKSLSQHLFKACILLAVDTYPLFLVHSVIHLISLVVQVIVLS